MRTKTPFLLVRLPTYLLAVVCNFGTPARAQYMVYDGGSSYHASTAAEGYGRGLSDIISAQGEYNLATSQAAINTAEAARREIENRQLWTDAYFEMRKANRAYRAEERGRRPTMEDAARLAQMGRPKRLSPKEFDYVTGKITWPKLLEQQQFEEERAQLDSLFEKRAQFGGVSFDEQTQIRESTNAMLSQLGEQVRELSVNTYIAGRRFLESLIYESQLPPNM